jgi:hypothetical protein
MQGSWLLLLAGIALAAATALSSGAATCYAQEVERSPMVAGQIAATPPPEAIVAQPPPRPVHKKRPYWIIGVVSAALALTAVGIELGVSLSPHSASSGTFGLVSK